MHFAKLSYASVEELQLYLNCFQLFVDNKSVFFEKKNSSKLANGNLNFLEKT